MVIKFHLVRFRPLCQLSRNTLHIDSGFHTLSSITFSKIEPRGIPYTHSKVPDLPYCPISSVHIFILSERDFVLFLPNILICQIALVKMLLHER